MKCKHSIITGGDYVPYGMSGAYLPDYAECDNPDVPEEEINELSCDESCPYYEADDEIPSCPPRYCGTCMPGDCKHHQE